MESLKSIQKFDEKYGDPRRRRQRKKAMGFGVISTLADTTDARVRQGIA
jgi:hypothetical protein